jgi:hypothetical protein
MVYLLSAIIPAAVDHFCLENGGAVVVTGNHHVMLLLLLLLVVMDILTVSRIRTPRRLSLVVIGSVVAIRSR